MTQTGMLLIISGPSGVGKTTVAHHVESGLGGAFSVSLTTRPKTAGDTDGVDYHFVDTARFHQMRDGGELLEWAEVFGHLYGTPKQPVLASMKHGRLLILEIDVQGAIQVKCHMPDAFAVFILPPNEQELLRRLRDRRRDEEAVIQRRFANAIDETSRARSCGVYDTFIVNDELQKALEETEALVKRQWAARRENATRLGQ